MLESDTKGGLPGVRKSILAICLWYKVSDIRIVEFVRQVEVVFCLGTLYDEIKYALKTAKSFTLIVIAIAVSSLICRIYWQNSPPITGYSYLFVVHLPIWTLALVLDFPGDDTKRPDVRGLRVTALTDRLGCGPLV